MATFGQPLGWFWPFPANPQPAAERATAQVGGRSDFFPLATQCYEAAAAKNPTLAGTIELKFRILGDPSVGGVVSEASLGEGTTIDDHEMQTCMKESMMSVVFAAPPHGGELTVTYPITFAPDPADGI